MENKYRNIMVGVEESENSKKVIEEAISLALEYGSQLYLTKIIHKGEPTVRSMTMEGLSDEEELTLLRDLTPWVNHAKDLGVTQVEAVVDTGDVKKLLASTLPEKYDVDLIVMGYNKRDFISESLIGSTTSYVIKHSSCSVLVVK